MVGGHRLGRLALMLALALLGNACWQPPTATPLGDSSKKQSIELLPLTLAGWEAKRQTYLPKIVVVDLWATWCVACIERFPKMVDMAKRYRQQNVQFVSLCLDDVNDTNAVAAAEDFLLEVGAEFDHFLIQESMLTAFEKLDLIGIPVVLLYDKSGKERVRLTGDDPNRQFSDADVEIALKQLLSES